MAETDLTKKIESGRHSGLCQFWNKCLNACIHSIGQLIPLVFARNFSGIAAEWETT